MRHLCFPLAAVALLAAVQLSATIFGSVHGLIHDPQHRPVEGANVVIHAVNSDWSETSISNDLGEFQFAAVPVGQYTITVTATGFSDQEQKVALNSGALARVHFAMAVAKVNETVDVSAAPSVVNSESSTTQSTVSRAQIARTPGAERTNSLAMITDYVPGAVVVHDQLHIRGGHQVSWLLDGVPVPNTNIASNIGPQFDPKDIDYLEVQRGGYSAEYGDRTYGVFNVVTRSGFERNNEGEIVASYGSFNTTNDQISFGSHTQRFAYYASVNGNRTDLGLQTPGTEALNDLGSGLGFFTSLIFNSTPSDQLRVVTSLRGDHYQVPNTPEQQQAGIRDVENERDAFVNFSWVHTEKNGILLTVSPFYHFNRAHYLGGPNDQPFSPEEDRGSSYAGGVVSLGIQKGKHNARLGFQAFADRDNQLFALTSASPGLPSDILFRQRQIAWGDVESAFLEEQYKATSWLTFNTGLRLTRFSGALTETAADPRIGAALRIPHLGWVLRGFWGRYYQAPPLLTLSGPALEFANQQGFGFLPLRGEKDEQHEFGLTVPFHGWTFDVDNFLTGARNYFDHDVLGNSNIFFPVTIDRARIRGWEATVRSPRLFQRAQLHLAYSHQYAEGRGGVTGGLTDFQPPASGDYYFLDHDQRNTLSTGFQLDLPWRTWTSGDVSYGSGFLNGDGPSHLPAHTTFDLSVGKALGESWSLQVSALNLNNNHFLVDNSNTFGGTHFSSPREISLQVKYRFHY